MSSHIRVNETDSLRRLRMALRKYAGETCSEISRIRGRAERRLAELTKERKACQARVNRLAHMKRRTAAADVTAAAARKRSLPTNRRRLSTVGKRDNYDREYDQAVDDLRRMDTKLQQAKRLAERIRGNLYKISHTLNAELEAAVVHLRKKEALLRRILTLKSQSETRHPGSRLFSSLLRFGLKNVIPLPDITAGFAASSIGLPAPEFGGFEFGLGKQIDPAIAAPTPQIDLTHTDTLELPTLP